MSASRREQPGIQAQVAGFAEGPAAPTRPIVFVMGPPRSGTTLTYQALAATGAFAYPSNLVARFPASPAFGWATQQLLAPTLPDETPSFDSHAGNTSGWSGPHEFSYFWRAHFPFEAHHQPPEPGAPGAPHLGEMARALAAMERVADAPLLFKNGLLAFVVPHLAEALPSLRVVRVRRPERDVCSSLLAMRERVHGDAHTWWSTRPREAAGWQGLQPEEQVVRQVQAIEAALDATESALTHPPIDLPYAALCRDPRGTIRGVLKALSIDGRVDGLPTSFELRTAR